MVALKIVVVVAVVVGNRTRNYCEYSLSSPCDSVVVDKLVHNTVGTACYRR